MMQEFPENIQNMMKASHDVLLTGSKYICPAVTPKDIDIMLLVDQVNPFIGAFNLHPNGNQVEYVDDLMVSCRYGIYNILLTSNQDYFNKWRFSTELAALLELEDKEHRKKLFQHICDNSNVTIGGGLWSPSKELESLLGTNGLY